MNDDTDRQKLLNLRRMNIMSIARITEISSTSTKSFEDAIQSGVARATQTLRNVRSAWVKEQQIQIENGKIAEYQVNLMITFVLDDADQADLA
jgi:flavin-binding protein dodecin